MALKGLNCTVTVIWNRLNMSVWDILWYKKIRLPDQKVFEKCKKFIKPNTNTLQFKGSQYYFSIFAWFSALSLKIKQSCSKFTFFKNCNFSVMLNFWKPIYTTKTSKPDHAPNCPLSYYKDCKTRMWNTTMKKACLHLNHCIMENQVKVRGNF